MKLDEIGIKYNTDKTSLDHDYLKFYEKHLSDKKDNIKKILELGIYSTGSASDYEKAGASMKMWEEYFINAEIYGLDLHDFSVLDQRHPRIHTLACNGDLREFNDFHEITNQHLVNIYNSFPGGRVGLNEISNIFGSEFDIIIDDGPHTMRSQQLFLGYMFKQLKSGGTFIIEDLHTGNNSAYWHVYNSYPQTNILTIDMLRKFKETGKIESDFIREEEKIYIENNFKEVFIEDSKYSNICFITKK